MVVALHGPQVAGCKCESKCETALQGARITIRESPAASPCDSREQSSRSSATARPSTAPRRPFWSAPWPMALPAPLEFGPAFASQRPVPPVLSRVQSEARCRRRPSGPVGGDCDEPTAAQAVRERERVWKATALACETGSESALFVRLSLVVLRCDEKFAGRVTHSPRRPVEASEQQQ